MKSSGTRWRVSLLAVLALAHLVVSLFSVAPGYLSVDEATFHMMVKGLAETGTFEIWNGYGDYASPELVSASIVAHDGRLVGQPPYLHPLLGVPFYRAWGYRGLFALNALALVGAVFLTLLIGRELFSSRDLALDACLILLLATFVWEYSQASWTHATALLFSLAAFYLALRAVGCRGGRSVRRALAAGLIGGFGLGIRLDMVLLLAALLVGLLLVKPRRPAAAVALAIGALPGLSVLAWTNWAKFGTLSPFAMGPEPEGPGDSFARYLPLALVVVGGLVAAWAIDHVDFGKLATVWRRQLVIGCSVAAVVLLALPAPRKMVWNQVAGTYRIGVDMRALQIDREERAMSRGDGRTVMYIGGYKKALLQSLPYLPILMIAGIAIGRREREASRLAWLCLPPLAVFGFYAQYSWHGGLALNQRYLVATLPYLAILTSWSLHRLTRDLRIRWRYALPLGLLSGGILFLSGRFLFGLGIPFQLHHLSIPLLLAGLLAVLLLWTMRGSRVGARLGIAVGALAAAGMTWAALVAFAYDYPLGRRARGYNLDTGTRTGEIVEADSLFFSPALDKFFAMIESDRVRIARPTVDDYGDFRDLIAFHHALGRRVYAAFDSMQWRTLERGPLREYRMTELWRTPAFVLAEIGEAPHQSPADPP